MQVNTNANPVLKGAFLVDQLASDAKTFFMTRTINRLVKSGLNSISVFRRNISLNPFSAHFGTFEAKHALYFKSPVIATDIFSAKMLLDSTHIGPRYFYVWDLDWLYKVQNYMDYEQIYSSDLKLISRCDQHAKLIEQCWKKPTILIEEFNYDNIATIFAR